MAVRIYGPNQTAGIPIVTTGKGSITSDGLQAYAQAVVSYDASGNAAGTTSYQLASSQGLAAAGTTTPVTGLIGGSYVWNVVGTFSGGSTVALQALASDGTTWQTIGSAVTASGNVGVVIGNNASVRLLGAVATTTALSSSLS